MVEIHLLNSPSGDDPPDREQLRGFAIDGSYSIRSLRPGKYWLLAIDPLHSGDVTNPDVMKALAAGATEVEVKEGDRMVKDLHIATKETGNGKKRLLAVFLATGALAFAQSPTPPDEKLASVGGVATHFISGAPLARVQVHLTGVRERRRPCLCGLNRRRRQVFHWEHSQRNVHGDRKAYRFT